MNSIFHRTSVRSFQDKEVEDKSIQEILRAGMQAPSAGNQQPWEFYVVKNPEIRKQLAETSPFAAPAEKAPVVIIPVYRNEGLRFPEYAQIDMSIATENMWLEADRLGLGAVWLGIAPLHERMEAAAKVLKLPENKKAFALLAVGYPAKAAVQQDRYDPERIHYTA